MGCMRKRGFHDSTLFKCRLMMMEWHSFTHNRPVSPVETSRETTWWTISLSIVSFFSPVQCEPVTFLVQGVAQTNRHVPYYTVTRTLNGVFTAMDRIAGRMVVQGVSSSVVDDHFIDGIVALTFLVHAIFNNCLCPYYFKSIFQIFLLVYHILFWHQMSPFQDIPRQ